MIHSHNNSKNAEGDVASLTRGKLLARNSLWNLFGLVLPMLAAIVTIPILINSLGIERFGILNIFWMLVSYFTLFDLGFGLATTRLVSHYIGEGDQAKIIALLKVAIKITFIFGIVACILLGVFSDYLSSLITHDAVQFTEQTRYSLIAIGIGLPFATGSTVLVGALSAYQKFKWVSYVRIPYGLSLFVLPVFIVQFSENLLYISVAITLGQILAYISYSVLLRKIVPHHFVTSERQTGVVKSFLSFGGWLTVSRLVGPMMVYFDRFIIAASLGASAVAYYATPFEIVFRILVLVGSITQVLMPALTVTENKNQDRNKQIIDKTVKLLLVGLFFVALTFGIFSHEIMVLWIDAEFAEESYIIVQIMSLSLIFNGLARLSSTQILSIGRTDLVAKLHLLELIPYLLLLWWAVENYGIAGAAFVFLARVIIDASFLWWLAAKYCAWTRSVQIFSAQWSFILFFSLLFLLYIDLDVVLKLVIWCAVAVYALFFLKKYMSLLTK